MSRQAVSRPFLNGPLRRASACGAICRATDLAASRAAASRANVSGSLSFRDSSTLRLFSRLSRKLIPLRIAAYDSIRVSSNAVSRCRRRFDQSKDDAAEAERGRQAAQPIGLLALSAGPAFRDFP